ncbi:uncharacterized protein ACA1_078940 [Acanthamoeba castellanii str. Neff]|uniref:RFX-type winged-helix domain-containing protein n=1 Tax=Acanthamoeba castellanii (strain ATCC 30010 / Neff) TaxID=1257118 RepID=L8GRK6_ACACF|nr:uncharacterized protein ACA1_078940 [Acanthamoeba castellanii str. Neff]ELR15809.1 hypothetical protein ACA1_078940 [Acanthamoeba castellanii str. Neff]
MTDQIPPVTRFVTGKDDAQPIVVEWASYARRPDGSVSKAAVYHEYAAFCEQRALEMANRSVFGKLSIGPDLAVIDVIAIDLHLLRRIIVERRTPRQRASATAASNIFHVDVPSFLPSGRP